MLGRNKKSPEAKQNPELIKQTCPILIPKLGQEVSDTSL